VAVLLAPVLRDGAPLGYGGFFLLMAEELAGNGFALPASVPFYGPGSTPFAYPPLGIYLMAGAVGPLGVPAVVYAKVVPPLWGLLLAVAVYGLARRLAGSRAVATISAALVMTNAVFLDYHTLAAGVVRGPAMAAAVAGLWAAAAALEAPFLWRPRLLAAVLFGLALLSHLTYGLFFLVSLAVFAVVPGSGSGTPRGRRLLVASMIAAGGAALALPWVAAVAGHWGVEPFLHAASTHGTLGPLRAAVAAGPRAPVALLDMALSLLERWSPALVAGLALAGLGVAAARRRWLLPGWAVAVFLTVGESERFLVLIGGFAAAVALGAVAEAVSSDGLVASGPARWLRWLPAALVVGLGLAQAGLARARAQTELSAPLLEAAAWMRLEAGGARYLELTGSHDVGEWLPFLTRSTPVVAPWGAEWNGGYRRQSDLFWRLRHCVAARDADCVEGFLANGREPVASVLVPVGADRVIERLTGRGWTVAFRNRGFAVLRRTTDHRNGGARAGAEP